MWSNFLNLFDYTCLRGIIFIQELCGENLTENMLDFFENTCKTLPKTEDRNLHWGDPRMWNAFTPWYFQYWYKSGADPGFPIGEGANIQFCQNFQKVKTVWGVGEGRGDGGLGRPLDPIMEINILIRCNKLWNLSLLGNSKLNDVMTNWGKPWNFRDL